ncbi:hypothetical protein AJ87_35580 [Rhizobium yanglingense]|nr:hypothetical protein AJ87_35580 [Rhizobium yanglingense]
MAVAIENEISDQQSSHHSMGHAFAGITSHHEHPLVARIATNETGVIDCLHHLPGPSMGLDAKIGH